MLRNVFYKKKLKYKNLKKIKIKSQAYRIFYQKAQKALSNQYFSRRLKKRNIRRKWITNTNAISIRFLALRYSILIFLLHNQFSLDRRLINLLIQCEPFSFISFYSIAINKFNKKNK